MDAVKELRNELKGRGTSRADDGGWEKLAVIAGRKLGGSMSVAFCKDVWAAIKEKFPATVRDFKPFVDGE